MGKLVSFHCDCGESTPENALEEDDNIMTHDENHLHFDDIHWNVSAFKVVWCMLNLCCCFFSLWFFPFIFPCLFFAPRHSVRKCQPILAFGECSMIFFSVVRVCFAHATHVYVHHAIIELLTTVEMSGLFTSSW